MAKYLFQAALTAEGLRGVLKEGGSARREVVRKAIEGLRGSLEAFYFGFGDKDVYVLADLPDNSAAAAFSTQTSSKRHSERQHDRAHHAGGDGRRLQAER